MSLEGLKAIHIHPRGKLFVFVCFRMIKNLFIISTNNSQGCGYQATSTLNMVS